MMLRLCLVLLTVGLTAELVHAQKPAAAAAEAARRKPAPVFLWEVRSETATVYLLGSIHVASKTLYPLDARIEQAFAKSDALVLETPATPEAQLEAAQLLQQAGMYTPPDSLAAHLDPATLGRLKSAAGKLGLPAPAVLMMKPWFASVTLAMTKLQSIGYHPQLGIDLHFHQAAGQRRIGAIETVEEQVALFRDMPEPEQVAALRQVLAQLPEMAALMQKAMQAWKRGDAVQLEKLLVEPTRTQYPALHRRMLVDRNRRMADAVERYLTGRGTTFVVVGSGHLVGKDSIVRMLEARGRKPRQL